MNEIENPLELEAQNLASRKKLAGALRSYGQMQSQMPQGQYVNGHFVAPNALESAAPALQGIANSFLATKIGKQPNGLFGSK